MGNPSQSMSKIPFHRLVAALAILTACGAPTHAQVSPKIDNLKIPFRIDLRYGCGHVTPKHPAPPAGAKEWADVDAWQRFLQEDRVLHDGAYSLGYFDKATEHATKAFQHSSYLPATGTVNWATYCRAFGRGKHPHAIPPQRTRFESRGSCHIRFPMFVGCADNPHYRDVSAWQRFLVEMGYMGAGYPNGSFDRPTRVATIRMEADFGLKPTGVVEMHAIHAAEHYENFTCTPVYLPCPHGRE
jgi:hypothetical protein